MLNQTTEGNQTVNCELVFDFKLARKRIQTSTKLHTSPLNKHNSVFMGPLLYVRLYGFVNLIYMFIASNDRLAIY